MVFQLLQTMIAAVEEMVGNGWALCCFAAVQSSLILQAVTAEENKAVTAQ